MKASIYITNNIPSSNQTLSILEFVFYNNHNAPNVARTEVLKNHKIT